jgi:hypothetical protein
MPLRSLDRVKHVLGLPARHIIPGFMGEQSTVAPNVRDQRIAMTAQVEPNHDGAAPAAVSTSLQQ